LIYDPNDQYTLYISFKDFIALCGGDVSKVSAYEMSQIHLVPYHELQHTKRAYFISTPTSTLIFINSKDVKLFCSTTTLPYADKFYLKYTNLLNYFRAQSLREIRPKPQAQRQKRQDRPMLNLLTCIEPQSRVFIDVLEPSSNVARIDNVHSPRIDDIYADLPRYKPKPGYLNMKLHRTDDHSDSTYDKVSFYLSDELMDEKLSLAVKDAEMALSIARIATKTKDNAACCSPILVNMIKDLVKHVNDWSNQLQCVYEYSYDRYQQGLYRNTHEYDIKPTLP
jgi:hypothetical protein